MAEKTTNISESKREAVSKLKELFGSVKDVIFTDFSGLNVAQISELRGKLRAQESEYRVIKNDYARIAIGDLDYPDVGDCLIGPTAVALVHKDVGPVAKTILSFARETTVGVKGAVVGGKLFDVEEVGALSKLPGRDELIAMLMSTFNAPLQNLVYALNALPTKLVRTVQAIADKKAES
jgi:large subunit ribosomal protein L10